MSGKPGRTGYCSKAYIIGEEPSSHLASDLCTEHHRPILSMIEGRGGRLRYIYIYILVINIG